MMKLWRANGKEIENAGCEIGYDRIEINHEIHVIRDDKVIARLDSSNNMILGIGEIPKIAVDGCDCYSCQMIRKSNNVR